MKKQTGFSLIELMVAVAVVGILGAVALPAYRDYVKQGRIPDATSNLASVRVQMEQWYQDNRAYNGTGNPCTTLPTSSYFTFTCSTITASAYTVQAAGSGDMTGFTYQIDQSNAKSTVAVPTGWSLPSPNNCWVTKKGGTC